MQQAEKNLAASKATLRSLQLSQEIEVLKAKTALERAKETLEQTKIVYGTVTSEKNLLRMERRFDATIIRAPQAGQILKINKRPGERIGTTPVLQLGNTREMHTIAEVYETDITFVEIGQTAYISSATFEGKIPGEVIDIGGLIYKNDILDLDPLADVDSRVVEVIIRLEPNETISRLTNLEVDCEIVLKGDG